MKFIISVLVLLILAQNISAQVKKGKKLISPVAVNKYFKDTLTFNKNWNYPWYIVVDDDGNMDNALDDTLTATDTARLYHTANCWTNHQGRHKVRYCKAIISNDTLSLFFQPELPAYASELTISIKDNRFWTDFSATYPARTGQLSWIITKQELVLDKNSYMPGDVIKGYLEVEFIEMSVDFNGGSSGGNYYYKGYIKTPLLNKE